MQHAAVQRTPVSFAPLATATPAVIQTAHAAIWHVAVQTAHAAIWHVAVSNC